MRVLSRRAPLSFSRRSFMLGGALAVSAAATRPAAAAMPIRFLLDWRIEGPTAPLLAAQERGYFRDEGLDVAFEVVGGPRQAVAQLASGDFDAALADVNALIRFRDANPGQDAQAVMMLYDRPAFAVIGRRSRGITPEPAGLEGRKLGAPAADAAFAQWPVFSRINQIDTGKVKLENIGFPVREPMLASGEVDAFFGFGPSSLPSLKARGVPADDIVVMTMAEHGLLLYGNAVMASGKLAAEEPGAVRGLLRAILRGIRDVAANPDFGTQLVARRAENVQPEVERERLELTLEQNMLTPYVRQHGLGGVDPARWAQALDQIALAQPFKDRGRAADSFSDAYLPARADRLF